MLSVTHLSSYLYCPRKLYLQKVLSIYEPPKEALVKGTIRHKMKTGRKVIERSELKKKILNYLTESHSSKEIRKQFSMRRNILFEILQNLIKNGQIFELRDGKSVRYQKT